MKNPNGCYFFSEEQDMGAIIPFCALAPYKICEGVCEDYFDRPTRAEIDLIREARNKTQADKKGESDDERR